MASGRRTNRIFSSSKGIQSNLWWEWTEFFWTKYHVIMEVPINSTISIIIITIIIIILSKKVYKE